MDSNRTFVTAALLASLGPLVGNGLYAGPGDDGEEILAAARDGLPSVAHLAFSLEVVGFAALVVLFAWLTARIFTTAPVAAVTTAIAGGAMVAVKLGSAAPWMVVNTSPERLDPVTAEALVAMNGMSFVVSGFLTCLAFLAAGVGLLGTSFPRWLGWWAVLAGGLGLVAGGVGILRPDAYLPIPFLLCLAWMIAAAVTTVVRGDTGEPIAPNRAGDRVTATQ